MKGLKEQVTDLKREKVLQVAGDLFFAKGFNSTSMDDIATALSIGKPMIYRYFPSKVALLAAVCSETSRMVASIAETLSESSQDTPAEQLKTIIYEGSLRIINGAQGLALLFREVKNVPKPLLAQLESSDTNFRNVMVNLFKEGKQLGQFNYVANEYVMAQSVSGLITWIFTWYRPDGPLTATEIAENMALTVLQMVGYIEPS